LPVSPTPATHSSSFPSLTSRGPTRAARGVKRSTTARLADALRCRSSLFFSTRTECSATCRTRIPRRLRDCDLYRSLQICGVIVKQPWLQISLSCFRTLDLAWMIPPIILSMKTYLLPTLHALVSCMYCRYLLEPLTSVASSVTLKSE